MHVSCVSVKSCNISTEDALQVAARGWGQLRRMGWGWVGGHPSPGCHSSLAEDAAGFYPSSHIDVLMRGLSKWPASKHGFHDGHWSDWSPGPAQSMSPPPGGSHAPPTTHTHTHTFWLWSHDHMYLVNLTWLPGDSHRCEHIESDIQIRFGDKRKVHWDWTLPTPSTCAVFGGGGGGSLGV